MRYLIFLLISTAIFASNILDTKILNFKDKIEIHFNFDTPYNGSIKLKREKDKIKLILKNAKSQDSWLKKVDTPFVYQIALQPKDDDSELIIYTIEKTALFASKSNDGYKLKLTIKKIENSTNKTKPVKEDSSDYNIFLYILGSIVIIALFILIFFLFTIKKKPNIKKKSININSEKEKNIKIQFEKPLDEKNKIALIEYNGVNYLVIIGSTNILLGKYKKGEIKSEEEFNRLVEETQPIKEDSDSKNDELLNELESYKEKVSKDY